MLSKDRLRRPTPFCVIESNNYYLVAFDSTLGLAPIPLTTISPAIAETTIAIRRTLRTLFTSKGVFLARCARQ